MHDEDHFLQLQTLKLATQTHTELILNREKKTQKIYQKIAKKLLQRENVQSPVNSRFYPRHVFKKRKISLKTKFFNRKKKKKKPPIRKEPF